MKKPSRNKKYAEDFAGEIIRHIKAGTAPWQKPWQPGEDWNPRNFKSGKRYNGSNFVYLMMVAESRGYTCNQWGTFKQISDGGGKVRRGEKGTPCLFVSYAQRTAEKDAAGKLVKDADGKTVYKTLRRMRPLLSFFTVFNLEQQDGIELPKREVIPQTWEAEQSAERIINATHVDFRYVPGDRAYYNVDRDIVTMPTREQFEDAVSYYQVALHELGHATGHEMRLNRDLLKDYHKDTQTRAKEELRAEICAMMTGTEIGIGHNPERGAAYVENWLQALLDDPREIQFAAVDAQKMSTYLLDGAKAKPDTQATAAA